MLPLNCGGDKCQVLVRGPVSLLTNWEHTLTFELIPKKSNYVKSTLSTWQSINKLEHEQNKKNWNSQEIIQTNVKGVKANRSQPNYGRITH